MAEHADHNDRHGDDPLWGVMAEFDNPAAISHAAEALRDKGFRKWDVYAPFPIHGIDEAMGLKPSRVSNIVAAGAVAGLTLAIILQWWTSAGLTVPIDWLHQFSGYPMDVGGKPTDAFEQFTPVMFELTVLISATSAFLAVFLLNGLPRHHHPLAKKPRFLRVSDDRFIIAVESTDPQFDRQATKALLADLGGSQIDEVQP
ncbi:MAG: DUF3341 domain-containing protein [Phycisphaerales bacterium]